MVYSLLSTSPVGIRGSRLICLLIFTGTTPVKFGYLLLAPIVIRHFRSLYIDCQNKCYNVNLCKVTARLNSKLYRCVGWASLVNNTAFIIRKIFQY